MSDQHHASSNAMAIKLREMQRGTVCTVSPLEAAAEIERLQQVVSDLETIHTDKNREIERLRGRVEILSDDLQAAHKRARIEPRAAYAVCGAHVDDWKDDCGSCRSAQAERASATQPPLDALQKAVDAYAANPGIETAKRLGEVVNGDSPPPGAGNGAILFALRDVLDRPEEPPSADAVRIFREFLSDVRNRLPEPTVIDGDAVLDDLSRHGFPYAKPIVGNVIDAVARQIGARPATTPPAEQAGCQYSDDGEHECKHCDAKHVTQTAERFIETIWEVTDDCEENAQTGEVTMDQASWQKIMQAIWDLGGRHRERLSDFGWSPLTKGEGQ